MVDTNDALILWLVRHGQTTWNSQGLISGWTDVPLTVRGEDMARALRPRLSRESFDEVWSSDLQRANGSCFHLGAAAANGGQGARGCPRRRPSPRRTLPPRCMLRAHVRASASRKRVRDTWTQLMGFFAGEI